MPESTLAPVIVDVSGPIARLTLNNPTRKNAITLEMAALINDFCDHVHRDESIGAVIIDGAGDYFCSGADTRDLASSSASPASQDAVRRTSAVYGAFVGLGKLPVPTVVLVQGGAVGAGLNLALVADLLLVEPGAVLDSGFMARQIHPGGGHLALLARAVGRQNAVAMAVGGAAMTGEQAVGRGLAWAAVARDELVPTAEGLLSLASRDPRLARRIKTSVTLEVDVPGVSWDAAVEIERGVQMWSMGRKGEAGWDAKPAKPSVGIAGAQ